MKNIPRSFRSGPSNSKLLFLLFLLFLLPLPVESCQPANLRLIFMALTLLKGLQMSFMFIFGILVTLDFHLHQAYGTHIGSVGTGLIFMAVFGTMNMVIGMRGSGQHNKFLLFVHLVFDLILFFSQVILGWILLSATIPEFSQELRDDCVNFMPLKFNFEKECLPYLQSERTSGFEIVWRSYYYESGRNADYYQKIIDLQRAGQCCGFGPPLRCTPWIACDGTNENECSTNDNFYRWATIVNSAETQTHSRLVNLSTCQPAQRSVPVS